MAEGTVLQKNPISRLQEILQQWKYPLPVYREAQGNYQEFGTEVSLTLDDECYTFSGLARTKKTSKANAAQRALDFIAQHKPNLLEPPPLPEMDESAMVSQPIWKKGGQLNKQHSAPLSAHELAKETERLDHVHVGLDMGRLIQQSRLKAGLTQKDLAGRINEKQSVIVDYESGRALPNQQIVAKMERALGGQLNKQHSAPVSAHELAKETERLDHVHVGLDMGCLIQQSRLKAGLTQKDLAGRINEKQSVIVDYESGRALPNQQIVAKMERALAMENVALPIAGEVINMPGPRNNLTYREEQFLMS